jgi:hypothetical protein
MELLMAIHDMDRGSVAAQDPLHQLTWCLDAASREHIIEGFTNEFYLSFNNLDQGV